MKFLVTVEVKAHPDDTCPDIESGERDFDSMEEAWESARQIESDLNVKYEGRGETTRARVVSIEPVGF